LSVRTLVDILAKDEAGLSGHRENIG